MKTMTASSSSTLLKAMILTGSSVSLFSPSSFAEVHPGKVLHESADCMKCHTAKPYNPQTTDSYPKLVKTVQFCNDNLNAGMFEDEVEQLADYLNQTYYHHSK
ncbi:hypothetical protein [Thiomicrorhabdus lithotrophica]|uniref:Cytochrome c domain-containing protein n=1 Tax=Thiomicrorhabdus lithotrophica TaxID=2949997 RepID=A0ABY8C7N2_9GAMM|nr:hypothetical protein [Thiomicrorhabdus lithotrophica]WEJ61557.1 hypothetical protein NR989_05950 [Thiomicrorhabdus lithotrophica]